ncbi:M57 family metalloprotease [Deminuibacter soli]|uniref:Protease n=1 Tax=Deminuibacter soli TaxID=2291815 RepID=A0A3E1NJK0_9BACT|nr:M57 family metalloprotease [Deminuibacter soli]RFM28115.1 protease [Deminuibacter soli]
MRKHFLFFALAACVGTLSCKKQDVSTTAPASEISSVTLGKIKSLGFSTSGVVKTDAGYLVEGDITLTDELLNSNNNQQLLRIAETEQYRTTNLVSAPRTIKIKVSNLGTAYVSGTDLAISRYNALGLTLTFTRITSGTADITIKGFNQGPSGGYITLGSSGFPSGGKPYGTIQMNTNSQAYGSNPDVNYVGSVIQHELGHCIGFRHTDYMNRSYSCGGAATNEGASNIGAILIPGTPSGPDANSWMLACSNGGNRTFNANDKVALQYLY